VQEEDWTEQVAQGEVQGAQLEPLMKVPSGQMEKQALPLR